jgi:hypothetical protein
MLRAPLVTAGPGAMRGIYLTTGAYERLGMSVP